MPLPEELDQHIRGEFTFELFQAPTEETIPCLFGCFCPCCAVYHQREQLLEITGEEYFCCAGTCPICCLKDEKPKVPCLCLESFCCPWWALSGNRYMVQTRFGKKNTACDNRILCCMAVMNLVHCIVGCFIDVPDEIDLCISILNCSVFGCMHGQQHREIEIIQKRGYSKPASGLVSVLPPEQQTMISSSKPSNQAARPGQKTMQ